jgi:hypothetical protein
VYVFAVVTYRRSKHKKPTPGAVVKDCGQRALTGSVDISVRKAPGRDLLKVELPLLVMLFIIFLVSALVTPGLRMEPFGLGLPRIPLCPLLELTGIPCLLCGMTRSFLSMGRLDWNAAFVFHPLGPALFIILVALALVLVVSVASRHQVRVSLSPALRRGLFYMTAFILLAAWPLKVVVWSQAGLL